jgi:3',5'-cyclic AMP phosphodiesterase CpdA
MFRLAQVTDPHFRSFAGARLGDFLGKRAVGAANLVVNRRRKHRMDLLEALGQDLRARAVDHVALTGDLGNVALESEWRAALRWVETYARDPETTTVIPGNHDTYVPDVVARGVFERIFAPYQSGERRGGAAYPFARVRGDVALVAVNTSVPTGDLGAWGEIGRAQLERLEALLGSPELASSFRVLLLHHPPVVHRGGEDRNLRDRAALAALLERTGVHLVIHGHDHRDERATLRGPGGLRIPVVGAGSASYAGGPDRRARYNVYEIAAGTVAVATYAHDESRGGFHEHHRETLG